MWCRLIIRRSASLHWSTSLVCYENFLSFSHCFHVFLLISLCNFPRVESIFRGLLLCWSKFYWFGCCVRSDFQSLPQLVWGIRWCRLPIFFSVFQLICSSCIFELSSGFHSAAFNNHLSLGDVAILIASLHFYFLLSHVPASHLLIVHLYHSFIGTPLNPILFFDLCSVDLFVNVTLEWHVAVLVIVRYIAFPSSLSSSVQLESMLFKSSLVFTLCFTIFLYLLFVGTMRRSILRWADCIILSCSLVGAHVPDA